MGALQVYIDDDDDDAKGIFIFFTVLFFCRKKGNMQFRYILLFGLILGLEITENYHSLNLSR